MAARRNFLSVKADGTVAVISPDSSGASGAGNMIYPSSDSTSPDRVDYAKDADGNDVTSVKCIRKNGMVEVVLTSVAITFNESYYLKGKTLGTLPEDMRPKSDLVEAINYGENNGYPGYWNFVTCKYRGCSTYNGEGTWTDGQIKSGGKYQGSFYFELERPLSYDVEITVKHSNDKTIFEENKNGDKFSSYISVHPFVIPSDTKKMTFMCMSNFKTTGRIYLMPEVKGIGNDFEQSLLIEVQVV